MSKKVTVIFTCFNRKEQSVKCIKSLVEKNKNIEFDFIIVDDGSSDGTGKKLRNLGYKIEILDGDGSLFWCGGMRKGIEHYLLKPCEKDTFCLLVNDDVEFYDEAVENIIIRNNNRENCVIVGALCDEKGQFTYGLKKKELWYKKNVSRKVAPSDIEERGDMFNANCVLIPSVLIYKVGNMDSYYNHSLGDYDYGFKLAKNGAVLLSSSNFVGRCNQNDISGTWNDKSLSRKERIKLKESIKGVPYKEWFYYLRKNYGMFEAIKYSITPYIRILIGK